MAIGSSPEIGVLFQDLPKDEFGWLDHDAMMVFYKVWKEEVGSDLLGGYATLNYALRGDANKYSK